MRPTTWSRRMGTPSRESCRSSRCGDFLPDESSSRRRMRSTAASARPARRPRGRCSLPQKTWRLRLVTDDGSNLPRTVALVRYVAGWIGPALALAAYAALRGTGAARWATSLLLFNYAWALVDPDRQFLHDRLAGTRVVDDAPARTR